MAGGSTSGSEASGTRERSFIGWDVGWHCDTNRNSMQDHPQIVQSITEVWEWIKQ